MMRVLQIGSLGAFFLCAAVTALLQVRYGMICGRSEQQDRQDDPKAAACRKRSAVSAVLAAAFLALAIVLGAVSRRMG